MYVPCASKKTFDHTIFRPDYKALRQLQGEDKKEHLTKTTMAAAFTHGVAPWTLDGLQRVTLSDIAKRVNEIQV